MGKIRGTHSSPGIYTKITDISYAAKTLGITTLGLVGETVKGPAFEPIMLSSWTQYTEYFGGVSAEKYKGTQYPRYELPYIAKEYLSVSDQLYVCRVLGLSGYNAGPTFVIKALGSDGESQYPVCVLRSRGTYKKYPKATDDCTTSTEYDTLKFDCNYITLSKYTNTNILTNDCEGTSASLEQGDFAVNLYNYGLFNINCYNIPSGVTHTALTEEEKEEYFITSIPVSFNVGTKDYIYSVLGSDPTEGSYPLFVEDLYDVMLENGIINGDIASICEDPININQININPICDPVSDFVKIDYQNLTRKMLGQTFLCTTAGTEDNGFYYYETDDDNNILVIKESGSTTGSTTGSTEGPIISPMKLGHIYLVSSYKSETGKKYVYIPLKKNSTDGTVKEVEVGKVVDGACDWIVKSADAVKVMSKNRYYLKRVINNKEYIVDQMIDMSDYREEFRCASTPWFVSELKGNGKDLEVKKLFRFHTITDGNYANQQVKVSIANVDLDEGTFDVYVREFTDTDGNQQVLESFKNCTMKQGESNYIGFKIGTNDGKYEIKSKYIMAEIVENDITENCVPCGFLGYPIRNFGTSALTPTLEFNLLYDSDIREKKQYFGISDIAGIDIDMFTYKGKNSYTERYYEGYTAPFHLDSRLSPTVLSQLEASGETIHVTIDGDENTSGITWSAVLPSNITDSMLPPIMGTSDEIEGTIYEDKRLRKFTACFCGGFDGWDIYRTSRTTGDTFKANKYKGKITNGFGTTFSTISNAESLALSGTCITSDYYAFLAGANQFENPEKYSINLFATPGIDYVNQTLLTTDIVEMLEEKRMDTFYVVTTPDKPSGATDATDEMYTASDAADNLDEAGIDTYYCATYYPWVKYYDSTNSVYLSLPATKDVLRNMADVDNKKYPWYAPAGTERGNVNCVKARLYSKLEDEDTLYDGLINPIKTFSKDGVKVWGNKTMYTGDTPMNRINVVRLMLYMRKLIMESCRCLIFEPNDATLKSDFENIVKPILDQIQKDRGITSYRLDISQTTEQMDAHEMSCNLFVKPTPTLEYIEINFIVTPQGVDFDSI